MQDAAPIAAQEDAAPTGVQDAAPIAAQEDAAPTGMQDAAPIAAQEDAAPTGVQDAAPAAAQDAAQDMLLAEESEPEELSLSYIKYVMTKLAKPENHSSVQMDVMKIAKQKFGDDKTNDITALIKEAAIDAKIAADATDELTRRNSSRKGLNKADCTRISNRLYLQYMTKGDPKEKVDDIVKEIYEKMTTKNKKALPNVSFCLMRSGTFDVIKSMREKTESASYKGDIAALREFTSAKDDVTDRMLVTDAEKKLRRNRHSDDPVTTTGKKLKEVVRDVDIALSNLEMALKKHEQPLCDHLSEVPPDESGGIVAHYFSDKLKSGLNWTMAKVAEPGQKGPILYTALTPESPIIDGALEAMVRLNKKYKNEAVCVLEGHFAANGNILNNAFHDGVQHEEYCAKYAKKECNACAAYAQQKRKRKCP